MLSSRTLLPDTDFFVLMAGANLIAPLLEVLGYEHGSVRRLAALPHMLKRGPLVRHYPQGVLEKASAWCEKLGAVESRPSVVSHEQLLGVVDPGEAFLLATVAELDDGVLATGDKRACVAVAAAPDLSTVHPSLTGKVLCLESSLDLLLEAYGFDTVSRALTPVRDYNRTIRLLLPEASATSEEHFRAGVASYLADLQTQAGFLLFQPS